MCFVLAWNTGFSTKLSHHSTETDSTLIPKSLNKDCNQFNSVVPDAKALYSASVLGLATTCCFFELQLIRFPPRKMQQPLVDLLSSTELAQSASEKHFKFNREVGLKQIPTFVVPFRYLSNLLQAAQWSIVGVYKNWLSLFTEKAILGLVNVRYCSAPIVLLYTVGFSNGLLSLWDNFLLEHMGDEQLLADNILVLVSKSCKYFLWVRIGLVEFLCASMPKK